jgi:hypothetical protein
MEEGEERVKMIPTAPCSRNIVDDCESVRVTHILCWNV